MKVVWICHFSNEMVRKRMNLNHSIGFVEWLLRKLLKKEKAQTTDFAQWITNGIEEFEGSKDIELFVISPHYNLPKPLLSFSLNGIHYNFFRPDDEGLFGKIRKKIFQNTKFQHKKNRVKIKNIFRSIKPDIIHMYGAENPYYSLAALDVDDKIYPFIVSLQTLLSDNDFIHNYPMEAAEYNSKVKIEKRIIKKARYIGTEIEKYRNIIQNEINTTALIFPTFLFLSQKIKILDTTKKFDFVYFASGINKASDLAIEAFAMVTQKYPHLTLNIVGAMPEPFTTELKKRIKELNIENNITFSGMLPSHNDVIEQIQYSKFALLPLKIDIITGTIREAMFSGLPVVTTITPGGTPTLNEKRESVLLSDKEDVSSIAANMMKLIEDPALAEKLKQNALKTVNEMWNNNETKNNLITSYKKIIQDHKKRNAIIN